MHYVYVLQNSHGENYIGQTKDLQRRLTEHNSRANMSTRFSSEWKLVYYEAYASAEDAFRREKRLKDDGRARYQLMSRISASKAVI